jgi:hypothetical protein
MGVNLFYSLLLHGFVLFYMLTLPGFMESMEGDAFSFFFVNIEGASGVGREEPGPETVKTTISERPRKAVKLKEKAVSKEEAIVKEPEPPDKAVEEQPEKPAENKPEVTEPVVEETPPEPEETLLAEKEPAMEAEPPVEEAKPETPPVPEPELAEAPVEQAQAEEPKPVPEEPAPVQEIKAPSIVQAAPKAKTEEKAVQPRKAKAPKKAKAPEKKKPSALVKTPQEEQATAGAGQLQTAETGASQGATEGPVDKAAAEPEAQKQIGPPVFKDIKIEVLFDSADEPDVSSRLLRRAHPLLSQESTFQKPEELAIIIDKEKSDSGGTSRAKRIFSVVKAGEGVYDFIMGSEGPAQHNVEVVFLLYEGGARSRTKTFRKLGLSPDTVLKLRFLLPEAVFWEDEDYFSGNIEDSDTVTKFNTDTGLVWKEKKDF